MMPSELIKSLHSLVKYNQGLWKSDRQAKYLMRELSTTRSILARPGDDAYGWAQRQSEFDSRTDYVVSSLSTIGGYGKKDPSKIRYTGVFFIVDGHGVKIRAKAKVHHPTRERPEVFLTGQATVNFTRQDTGEVFLDQREEERRIEEERQQTLRANQPFIDQIKTIPGWQSKDILQSFLDQLERGHPLSVRQKGVLQRMLPSGTAMDFGDPDEWLASLARIDQVVKTCILPTLGEIYDEIVGDGGPSSSELRQEWATYSRGGEITFGLTTDIMDIFSELTGNRFGTFAVGYNYHEMRDKIETAADKQRRNKRLTKNLLNAIKWVSKLANALRSVTPAKGRAAVIKSWENHVTLKTSSENVAERYLENQNEES